MAQMLHGIYYSKVSYVLSGISNIIQFNSTHFHKYLEGLLSERREEGFGTKSGKCLLK